MSEEKNKLTDRELLTMAYGAMSAVQSHQFKIILQMIEEHLYPPKIILKSPSQEEGK